MSRTDPLTGLLNVRYLTEILTQALRSAQRRSELITVVYLDVNNFKAINDHEGHLRGDEVLRNVAEVIKKISRIEDSCFRYGGDEFCIILSNCGEIQAEEVYMKRLSLELQSREKNVTLSVGCVETGPQDYKLPEELIRLADQRMYACKAIHKH